MTPVAEKSPPKMAPMEKPANSENIKYQTPAPIFDDGPPLSVLEETFSSQNEEVPFPDDLPAEMAPPSKADLDNAIAAIPPRVREFLTSEFLAKFTALVRIPKENFLRNVAENDTDAKNDDDPKNDTAADLEYD